MQVQIALLRDRRAPISKSIEIAWDQLGKLLGQHRPVPGLVQPETVADMKDGPAWMPAQIELGPRKTERVQAVTALVLDIEADKSPGAVLPPAFDVVMAEIARLGWSAHGHTSFQHQPKAPRYRLVFEIDRHLFKEELKALGLHVAALLELGQSIDRGALEPARLYYLPRCPEGNLSFAQAASTEGKPLDVDGLLAQIAPVTKLAKPSTSLSVAAVQVHSHTPQEISDDLLRVSADMAYSDWLRVLFAVASTGIHEAESIARQWSSGSPKYNSAEPPRNSRRLLRLRMEP